MYGPGVAAKMSGDTGGRVINVRNEKGLEKAFDEISEELRSQYVLGYYPANHEARRLFPQDQGRSLPPGYQNPGSQGLLRAGALKRLFSDDGPVSDPRLHPATNPPCSY